MKIAMLGHKRMPSREGGIEIVVEELSTRMAEMGHDVTVYNRKGSHVSGYNNINIPLGDNYEYKGVHVRTAFTFKWRALNALVYSFFATIKAINSRCDVIHFHAEGPCAMIPMAKRRGKRCVATIHGLDWKRAKWGDLASKMLLYGEEMAALYADEIIVLSQGDKDYFKQTYNRDTTLIPNGINAPQATKARMIKLKHNLEEDQYILFVARIVPEKGVHTLIEAYSKSGINIPLVIAGGPSHSEEYFAKIKTSVDRFNDNASRSRSGARIVMTGFVQGKELEELYSNALLYVLPSEIEGMPLSLLEAMSYGNVCLVSDIPENTSVVQNHGFCFDSKDSDSLCASMIDILNNMDEIRNTPEYSKYSISNHVLTHYNWDVITRMTLSVYKAGKGDEAERAVPRTRPEATARPVKFEEEEETVSKPVKSPKTGSKTGAKTRKKPKSKSGMKRKKSSHSKNGSKSKSKKSLI